jgi:hypothetical protein
MQNLVSIPLPQNVGVNSGMAGRVEGAGAVLIRQCVIMIVNLNSPEARASILEE